MPAQFVDQLQCPWLVPEKLEQLAGAGLELAGCGHHVAFKQVYTVQGLAEQGGEILVLGTDRKSSSLHAFQPEFTWLLPGRDLSLVKGQVDAESKECHLPVPVLAATLAGRTLDTAFPVRYHDCRFHLVAVLTARAGPSLAANIAPLKQLVCGQTGWMDTHGTAALQAMSG